MNHVLPVSGHPVVIHVPVCRSVDCIFCEDLCADGKNIGRPKCSTQFGAVATERRPLDASVIYHAPFGAGQQASMKGKRERGRRGERKRGKRGGGGEREKRKGGGGEGGGMGRAPPPPSEFLGFWIQGDVATYANDTAGWSIFRRGSEQKGPLCNAMRCTIP
jgi:hypothetical protein